MKLRTLIEAANTHYPDEFLTQYFDLARGRLRRRSAGDGLARFVVVEIVETYESGASDAEQIDRAIRVVRRAEYELGSVVKGLEELRSRTAA